MRYRVDDLAVKCGVSVDTIRYYQTKGLLPLPEREGRVGWYGEDHVERLTKIRDLKGKGFTLGSIARLLAGDLDPADSALIDALAGTLPGGPATESEGSLSLDELATKTGVPTSVLQVIEREGLFGRRSPDAEPTYSESDVAVVKAGMELLESGLPLSELLALAREHDVAMQHVAKRAVDLFVEFVRDPARASASDSGDAAEKVVESFQRMLGATTQLVSNHFRTALLAEAQARIELETGEDSA